MRPLILAVIAGFLGLLASVVRAQEAPSPTTSDVAALLERGQFLSAIPQLSRLVEETERHGDRSQAVRLLLTLAGAQQSAGKFAGAEQSLDRASTLSNQLEDAKLASLVVSMQGTNLALTGRSRDAQPVLECALAMAENESDSRGQIAALNGLAGLDLVAAKFAEANQKLNR